MRVMYDFKCPESGHTFEALVEKGTGEMYCPMCNEVALKQFSAPVPHFKGKGFYCTDYKKK